MMKLTSSKNKALSVISIGSANFSDLVLAMLASLLSALTTKSRSAKELTILRGRLVLAFKFMPEERGSLLGSLNWPRQLYLGSLGTQQNQSKRMTGCLVVLNGMFLGTL